MLWRCHLPLHVAGSGGRTYVGTVEATEQEVREAWDHCATIRPDEGTVHFYRRPGSPKKRDSITAVTV